jgi:DNA-binding GntR family transcriptional regulator
VETDPSSSTPLYRQIADQIRDDIRAGRLDGRLPSAVAISQETGVAILTGRRALRALVEDGWAEMTPGLGTYSKPRDEWPEG